MQTRHRNDRKTRPTSFALPNFSIMLFTTLHFQNERATAFDWALMAINARASYKRTLLSILEFKKCSKSKIGQVSVFTGLAKFKFSSLTVACHPFAIQTDTLLPTFRHSSSEVRNLNVRNDPRAFSPSNALKSV